MADLTLTVEPILEGLRPGHPAYLAASEELLQLSPNSEAESLESTPGAKGHPTELAWQLAPAAPVVVGALLRAWRLWLQRDGRRSLKVTVKEAGVATKELTIDGENISLETLENAIVHALGQDGQTRISEQDSAD